MRQRASLTCRYSPRPTASSRRRSYLAPTSLSAKGFLDYYTFLRCCGSALVHCGSRSNILGRSGTRIFFGWIRIQTTKINTGLDSFFFDKVREIISEGHIPLAVWYRYLSGKNSEDMTFNAWRPCPGGSEKSYFSVQWVQQKFLIDSIIERFASIKIFVSAKEPRFFILLIFSTVYRYHSNRTVLWRDLTRVLSILYQSTLRHTHASQAAFDQRACGPNVYLNIRNLYSTILTSFSFTPIAQRGLRGPSEEQAYPFLRLRRFPKICVPADHHHHLQCPAPHREEPAGRGR